MKNVADAVAYGCHVWFCPGALPTRVPVVVVGRFTFGDCSSCPAAANAAQRELVQKITSHRIVGAASALISNVSPGGHHALCTAH